MAAAQLWKAPRICFSNSKKADRFLNEMIS
ncbi:hypothetical protein QFZ24_000643 [Streptomyces phaeochromogenes]|nr:hypothetical protein [Streptomyces phaeochromogenes]